MLELRFVILKATQVAPIDLRRHGTSCHGHFSRLLIACGTMVVSDDGGKVKKEVCKSVSVVS
jgi:hypothetical protein